MSAAVFSIGAIYPAQNGGHSICVTGITGGRLEFIHGRQRGDGVSGGARSAPLQVADDGIEFVEDIFLFYRADDIGKLEKTTSLLWRYTKNGRRKARKEAACQY